jgi:hypothetical protein
MKLSVVHLAFVAAAACIKCSAAFLRPQLSLASGFQQPNQVTLSSLVHLINQQHFPIVRVLHADDDITSFDSWPKAGTYGSESWRRCQNYSSCTGYSIERAGNEAGIHPTCSVLTEQRLLLREMAQQTELRVALKVTGESVNYCSFITLDSLQEFVDGGQFDRKQLEHVLQAYPLLRPRVNLLKQAAPQLAHPQPEVVTEAMLLRAIDTVYAGSERGRNDALQVLACLKTLSDPKSKSLFLKTYFTEQT